MGSESTSGKGQSRKGGCDMKRIRAVGVVLLCATLLVGLGSLGIAGEGSKAAVMPFEGQVKSVKVDTCGMQPGMCEGSIVLAKKGGGEVSLGIKAGTWIKRGDNLVTIGELGVGNYVKVQAMQLAGETTPRITWMDAGSE